MGTQNKDAGELPPCLSSERNLVLIGYRATGKTEVGALLALKLERPFVDLDEALVAEMGYSIADLVAEKGWPEFRRREKEMVARYGRSCGRVLATGGGVVLDPENVEILRKNGVVVWLRADPGTIRQRLSRDEPKESQRPSLTGGGTLDEVEEVLQSRQPMYAAAAHVVIDTAGQSIEQVAEKVLTAVKEISKN
ncbi:MAG: shikimate kinase [Deltaproteobacteria bacterium]|nr:shikimate kinase [Deltaproteobacteria bacterium]MBI4794333.1 shikimate kinase [Deltaproteobacteria bacterium]